MLIALLLLVAVLGLLGWFVRNDRAEYARFKALTRTEERQHVFRRWLGRSFLLFSGASLAVLLLLGRLDALVRAPAEFSALMPGVDAAQDVDIGFAALIAGGIVGGAVAGAVIARLARRRRGPAKPKLLGDIAPMLPRNREERRWTALLGANAGLGEELFFRLMLPLLIARITGSALAAFAVAGLIFGLVHLYQGWVGIAATTVIGFVFAFLYLATGAIWVAILLHALMNLNSLWLRPLLAERAQPPSR